MKNKLLDYQRRALHLLQRFGDIKFTGQVVFVAIVLLVSWSGVKSIQANYELQKQISALNQQNKLQELSNANLKLENQYYSTDSYLDLSARQNFGLGAPGEKEIIVPKEVALKNVTAIPQAEAPVTPSDKQPAAQRNLQAWVDFFLHRQDV